MARGVLPAILTFLGFGIVVPWIQGLDLLDPIVILTYAALPFIFAVPLAANSPRNLTFPIFFSCGLFALTLIQAVLTINYKAWSGHILFPDWTVVGAAVALGIAGTCASAIGAAVLSVRSGPKAAHGAMRLVLLAVLVLMVWLSRSGNLPASSGGLAWLGMILAACLALFSLVLLRLPLRKSPSPSPGPLYGLEKD